MPPIEKYVRMRETVAAMPSSVRRRAGWNSRSSEPPFARPDVSIFAAERIAPVGPARPWPIIGPMEWDSISPCLRPSAEAATFGAYPT